MWGEGRGRTRREGSAPGRGTGAGRVADARARHVETRRACGGGRAEGGADAGRRRSPAGLRLRLLAPLSGSKWGVLWISSSAAIGLDPSNRRLDDVFFLFFLLPNQSVQAGLAITDNWLFFLLLHEF